MTAEVEQRVLLAKRARALALQGTLDCQFDYVAEKMVPAVVQQGRQVETHTQFERLRTSMQPLETSLTETVQASLDASKSPVRPHTQSLGRRIYER